MKYLNSQNLSAQKAKPGHFNGVLNVIFHLFNLVKPNLAVFGQKDYQQFLIIQRFCRDVFPEITVESAPIVREPGGLALSSRNGYLNNEEKQDALSLSKTLHKIARDFKKNKDLNAKSYERNLNKTKWDYLEILDAIDLSPYLAKLRKYL